MDISVVIPAYNRADLLAQTLDAILAQTLPARELLVVDDGSSDGTPAVLNRYAPAVRALRIANSGEITARNIGVRAVSGEFVAFCDSDDLWRPEHLAAMADLWAAEPAAKLAFSDFVIVRDGAWETSRKFATAPPGFWDGLRDLGADLGVFDAPVPERLLRFQPFFPSCMVIRRDAFIAAGGWDEGVNRMLACDFATTLRVAELTPFGVVSRPTVGIRKHSGNFSGDVQSVLLGESRVLEHVLATQPAIAALAPAIHASIGRRRREALEIAFARLDLASVRTIFALLPPGERSAAIRLKHAAAALPAPVNRAAASVLTGLGTMRARSHGGRRQQNEQKFS